MWDKHSLTATCTLKQHEFSSKSPCCKEIHSALLENKLQNKKETYFRNNLPKAVVKQCPHNVFLIHNFSNCVPTDEFLYKLKKKQNIGS
jgi:hypothetical protein